MAATPFSALNAACLKTFGSRVSYQQGAGTPFTVTGVFEKGTDEERLADGLYARLFVNLADFTASPATGDEATVAGVTYTVFQILADATGGVWLSLREKT